MNRSLLSLLLILCVQYYTFSQELTEKTFVKYDADLSHFFEHSVSSGESLYSISKRYNTDQTQISSLNNLDKKKSINLGQSIKIPFLKEYLLVEKPAEIALPIYYKAIAKDNIFRIAKIYFNQSIERMMRRNKLEDLNISLGQELLVGWYPLYSEEIEITNAIDTLPFQKEKLDDEQKEDLAYFVKNISEWDTSQMQVDTSILLKEYTKSKGIAFWNKNSSDTINLFALHQTAKINSSIKIYNPLLNRTVWAQVIGKFDKSLYSSDIDIIISPRVAQELGMKDKRFGVELEFTD